MRAAPAVHVALASGGRERMVITLLHGLAGAHLAAWLASLADWPMLSLATAAAGSAAVLSAIGASVARRLLPPAPLHLRWDGQAWHLQGMAVTRLVVALDLGPWLILRMALAGQHAGTRWCVADARAAGASWHGLRVALASHASALPVADGAADKAAP